MAHLINTGTLTNARWIPGKIPPEKGREAIQDALIGVTRPVVLIRKDDRVMSCREGTVLIGDELYPAEGYPLEAFAPPLHPENLGEATFKKRYRLRYAYVAGAMANGITSVEMVKAAAQAGMMAFFGAAGLNLEQLENAIHRLQQSKNTLSFGFNLIYSPNEPELEARVVELYLKRGINLISASAYMEMTLPLVYYRVKGIHRDQQGHIVCPNRVVAKVSRVEIAKKFFSPPPEKLLQQLVDQNMITREELELARNVPVAEDLTAEADSGGHTDNRPAISLLPTMLALRDEIFASHPYQDPLHVGLGGGVSTPDSTAAAFAMGAAYVLTGSVNQACVEAGTSEAVRNMLAEAGQADVVMAPAADMFEMGVKVQVLKRGTMFPFRASKLYDLYSQYSSFDEIPEKERTLVERDFFKKRFQEEWKQTCDFFSRQDPKQIQRAETDLKHKMALVFRSYLGKSSNWANMGVPDRRLDYQIWCGPAMGAFNEWVKGSFLEKPENRETVTVAMNLLMGAAVATRLNWIRTQAADLPTGLGRYSPLALTEIKNLLSCK